MTPSRLLLPLLLLLPRPTLAQEIDVTEQVLAAAAQATAHRLTDSLSRGVLPPPVSLDPKDAEFAAAVHDVGREPTQEERAEFEGSFPHLKSKPWKVIGECTARYNCIAWSVKDDTEWLWPGNTVEIFDKMYAERGYAPTDDPRKAVIALFRDPSGAPTHACRKEAYGWSSKCGGLAKIAIRNTSWLENDGGGIYGKAFRYYAAVPKPLAPVRSDEELYVSIVRSMGREPDRRERRLFEEAFPGLRGKTWKVIGECSNRYNCIAWSVKDQTDWLWTSGGAEEFDAIYEKQGYVPTDDPKKAMVVLYASADGKPTHACRKEWYGWSSKCGSMDTITIADADWLSSDKFGKPFRYYTKKRS